jgi:site-specific DNA-methyltransferase (adenine-specific)
MKSEAFLMDCMEGMKNTPDNYYDLAVVDPPYGININTNMGRRRGDKKSNYHKFAGEDKSIPSKDYFDELFRVSKNQIIWGGNYMTEYLKPSSCWILWDKLFSEDVTFAQYEMAWTSFGTSAKKFTKHPSQQGRIHPTQKPVELYDWIFANYATPGMKILDTHLGSGSSRIAAYKAKLDFTGYEIDAEYFEAQEKRFQIFIAQGTLF